MLFREVLNQPASVTDGILIPWVAFFAIATVVSILAVVIKAKVFVKQLRERRDALDVTDSAETATTRKLKEHHKKVSNNKDIMVTEFLCLTAHKDFAPD